MRSTQGELRHFQCYAVCSWPSKDPFHTVKGTACRKLPISSAVQEVSRLFQWQCQWLTEIPPELTHHSRLQSTPPDPRGF